MPSVMSKRQSGENKMDTISNPYKSEKVLAQKKIAIINPWENKFTQLYFRYFQKHNDVRLINPQSVINMAEVLEWADLVWSQWANEWLAHISKQKFSATLITHIHSYEILVPELMKNIDWSRVAVTIFISDHIRLNAHRLWASEMADVPQATIYNCVDLAEYPFRDVRPGKNIGYVGYINHKKGVGLLLQCIKAIVGHDPEFTLHIAGTFQERRFEVYMQHLIEEMGIKENIVFHGWVENIQDWLANMNYIISTSPWEGCPLNIIEAMACGVKPLIHNWQGAKRLFPEQFVFNTVEECLSIVRNADYDSAFIRGIVEKRFNAKRNIPMIEAVMVDAIQFHSKKDLTTQAGLPTCSNQNKRTPTLENDVINAPPKSAKQSINFVQPLAKTVELSSDRKDFTMEFCRGKRVLHVGCVDAGIMDERIDANNFLHYQIANVAEKVIGADIEQQGLDRLAGEGFEVYHLNLENDGDLLKKLAAQVDVIVLPEVIEHLNNVGMALENLKACGFKGEILLSTPNAFSFRTFKLIGKCVELVHPDHNYYFSPMTLKTILSKHGFDIERLVMYYWPTNDLVGKDLQKFVTQNPYYGEGIIAIIRDISS
jgi:glycosyltransferase involved in cell wall biosynthesis/2-polyprenyl-3-methyl-5-hydroxy-6-metoxy-1,4-benzoquinol methylase